jgi:hypothetical protein
MTSEKAASISQPTIARKTPNALVLGTYDVVTNTMITKQVAITTISAVGE